MNIIPYVYDFVSFIFDNPDAKNCIRHIILFGSAARGDFDKKSDVDIFIDTTEGLLEKAELIVKKAEKRFYLSAEKKWSLRGIDLPVRYIVADLESYRWKEIKSDIISNGLVFYGKYQGVKDGLSHYSLFTYKLEKLEQKKKMQFIRRMFGYKIKKEKKTYKQEGLLKKIEGSKLEETILVPAEKTREIREIFSKYKITPEIREIWTKH